MPIACAFFIGRLPRSHYHYPRVSSAAELDDEVHLWLCEAYRSAQQLPSLPTETLIVPASSFADAISLVAGTSLRTLLD
jgi:hypothetical protein